MTARAAVLRPPRSPLAGSALPVGLVLFAGLAGAVAAVKPSYSVALVGAVAVALLVGANVTILPVFLILTMFTESLSLGHGLTIGRLGGVLALLVVAVYALLRGVGGLRPSALLATAFAFGVWIVASTYWARFPTGVASDLGKYGLVISYSLSFPVLVRTRRQLEAIFATLSIGALVFGLVSIATFAASHSSTYRSSGLQGDPNTFALYQAMSLPAALALAALTARPRRRLVLYAAVGVIVISIASTVSRSGLLALLAVVLLTLVAPWRVFFRRRSQKLAYAAVLVAGAAVTAVIGSSSLLARISSSGGDRGSGRIDLWGAAWHGFRAHPWFGIGAGNFPHQVIDLLQATPGVNDSAAYIPHIGRVVHNSYLGMLTELGIVGLAIFLLLIGLTGVALVRSFRRARAAAERTYERFSLAVAVALAAFMVSAFFLSIELNKPLWILVGLALTLEAMTRDLVPVHAVEVPYAAAVIEQPRKRPAPAGAEWDGLERRRRALKELDGELQQRLAALEARSAELDAREQELEQRLENLRAREAKLVNRVAELGAREVEEAVPPLPPPKPPLERVPVLEVKAEAPEPAAEPPAPEKIPAQGGGAWLLPDLEGVVAALRETDPERAEELAFYVVYLREYAQFDGSLPASFDGMIDDVFGDLLPG